MLSKVNLNATPEDIDVTNERKRVTNCHDLLKIQNLTKVYEKRTTGKKKNLLAVDR